MDEITIRWLRTRFPGEQVGSDPNDGTAWDRDVAVGRVALRATHIPEDPQWDWSMFVDGRVPGQLAPGADRGREQTREAAQAAVEAAYRKLLAMDPEKRDAIRAASARVKESAKMWAARGRTASKL